jgi:hypothetical protein
MLLQALALGAVPDGKLQNCPLTAPGAPDVTVCGPPCQFQLTVPPWLIVTVCGTKAFCPLAPTVTVTELVGVVDDGGGVEVVLAVPLSPPQPPANNSIRQQDDNFIGHLRPTSPAIAKPIPLQRASPSRTQPCPIWQAVARPRRSADVLGPGHVWQGVRAKRLPVRLAVAPEVEGAK